MMENEKLTSEYLLKIYNETPWKFANITPEKMAELFKNPGFAYYKPVKETPELLGDSGEYELLTEAVELSKDVEGILCEVGVRMGMGSKYIIDAAIEYRSGSTVIGIDPYGSILYTGREHMGPCRLDYTNDMAKNCLVALSNYVLDKNVNWLPIRMTDTEYFRAFAKGIEVYDLETTRCNKYAMVHLDGTHTVESVSYEVIWFDRRMDIGATIVIDDVTPDFVDIAPIQKLFDELGWAQVKMGLKKGLWQKK